MIYKNSYHHQPLVYANIKGVFVGIHGTPYSSPMDPIGETGLSQRCHGPRFASFSAAGHDASQRVWLLRAMPRETSGNFCRVFGRRKINGFNGWNDHGPMGEFFSVDIPWHSPDQTYVRYVFGVLQPFPISRYMIEYDRYDSQEGRNIYYITCYSIIYPIYPPCTSGFESNSVRGATQSPLNSDDMWWWWRARELLTMDSKYLMAMNGHLGVLPQQLLPGHRYLLSEWSLRNSAHDAQTMFGHAWVKTMFAVMICNDL